MTTFLARIRRAVYGRHRGLQETVASSIREANRAAPEFLVPYDGPFDEPPPEPVELDAASLPWELRDETRTGTPPPTDPASKEHRA